MKDLSGFPEQVQEHLSCNCSCRHMEITWRLPLMTMVQENSKGAANISEQLPTQSPASGYGSSLINRPLTLQFGEKKKIPLFP